jgi:hypothetical protein
MPTAEEHRQKAEHNLAFLGTIDTDEFCDWMAVAAFYAAVHLVERIRAVAGGHSIDHADRLKYIRDHHPQIHADFRELYNISLIVRYGGGPSHWLLPEHILGRLEQIRAYVSTSTAAPST